MEINLATTVAETQNWIADNIEEGCECPCCSQFIKRYERKFNKSMAYALVAMYKLQGESNEFIRVNDEFTNRNINYGNTEFSKLRCWGFAEQLSRKDKELEDSDLDIRDGRTSGYWRLTEVGKLFAQNKCTAKKYAIIQNKKVIALAGDDIYIRDAFKEKFNYDELMGMSFTEIIRQMMQSKKEPEKKNETPVPAT